MPKRFVGFIHCPDIGTFDRCRTSYAVSIMLNVDVYAVYRGDITQQQGSKEYLALIDVVNHFLRILPGVHQIHYVLVVLT
jgi:hypothetical protein